MNQQTWDSRATVLPGQRLSRQCRMAVLEDIQSVRWRCLRRGCSKGCAPWARQMLRYSLALVFTAAALLVRFHLDRAFHDSDAYVVFLMAVIATNWLCGLGPCLLTLWLGMLAGTWFFAQPRGTLLVTGANQWFDLMTYLAAGAVIAWYGWARRKAEDRLGSEVEQRQQAEEALRRAHESLEQRVQERTMELEQSIRGMREFTYSIAHNLFAPLRAAHGFAELLLARYGPQLEQLGRDYAGHVLEASQRMGHLLDALLVYGRVASMEAPLDSVDTGEVVQEAVRRVHGTPGNEHARIEVQRPLAPVLGNTELLTEALFCLLDNAVKYARNGTKPHVRVRTEPWAEGVRLRVEDNGVGIARQYHVEIFGAFNRLVPDGSSSTGMGLTIAQKAVERMRGQIGLDSEPGRGSCFWVDLRKPR